MSIVGTTALSGTAVAAGDGRAATAVNVEFVSDEGRPVSDGVRLISNDEDDPDR